MLSFLLLGLPCEWSLDGAAVRFIKGEVKKSKIKRWVSSIWVVPSSIVLWEEGDREGGDRGFGSINLCWGVLFVVQKGVVHFASWDSSSFWALLEAALFWLPFLLAEEKSFLRLLGFLLGAYQEPLQNILVCAYYPFAKSYWSLGRANSCGHLNQDLSVLGVSYIFVLWADLIEDVFFKTQPVIQQLSKVEA